MLVWLKAIFQALGGLFQLLNNKQLLDAGADRERADVYERSNQQAAEAKEIKREVDSLDDASLDSSLHDFTRPDK